MSPLVDADAHPERMAPDLADGDQSAFAAGAFVVLEGRFALGLHVRAIFVPLKSWPSL